MRNRFPRRLLSFGLTLLLVTLTLLPPIDGSAVHAQNLHPACLNDQGNPAIPRINGAGAEVLILNFNHTPNTATTKGCVGMRDWVTPNKILYHLVDCPLVNNVNNIAVGDGTAPFDGVFWVECPAGTLSSTYASEFYVYAKATFFQPSIKGVQWYTLMEHTDVSFKANIDANWHPTLQSRYDSTTFTNYGTFVDVSGGDTQLKTEMSYGIGTHKVNGAALLPTQSSIPDFYFDGGQPIIIGTSTGSRPWDLHIILIDPPSAYS